MVFERSAKQVWLLNTAQTDREMSVFRLEGHNIQYGEALGLARGLFSYTGTDDVGREGVGGLACV